MLLTGSAVKLRRLLLDKLTECLFHALATFTATTALQPRYRPSAKNTTSDCASWKAKSTTLSTWSGRKTTRSVTRHRLSSLIATQERKEKKMTLCPYMNMRSPLHTHTDSHFLFRFFFQRS